MSNTGTAMWVKFFNAAGIPSPAATTYAHKFVENRIQIDMLTDLNKDYLREMGITLMGDIIAILRHSKQICDQTAREKIMNIEGSKADTIFSNSKMDDDTPVSTSAAAEICINDIDNGSTSSSSNGDGAAATNTSNSSLTTSNTGERKVTSSILAPRRLVIADPKGKYIGTSNRRVSVASLKTGVGKLYSDEITVGKGSIFDRISSSNKNNEVATENGVRIKITAPGTKPTSTSIFSRLGKKPAENAEITKHLKPILKNSPRKNLTSIVKAKTITHPSSQNVYVVRKVPLKIDSDDDFTNDDDDMQINNDLESIVNSEKIVKFAKTAEVREIYSPRRKHKRNPVTDEDGEARNGYGSGIRSSVKSRLGINGRLHSTKKSYNLKASPPNRLSPITTKTLRLKSDELILNKDGSVLTRLGTKPSVDVSSLSHRIGKVSLSSQGSPPRGSVTLDNPGVRQDQKVSVFDRLGFQ